jgi:hypothetical protein
MHAAVTLQRDVSQIVYFLLVRRPRRQMATLCRGAVTTQFVSAAIKPSGGTGDMHSGDIAEGPSTLAAIRCRPLEVRIRHSGHISR